MNPDEKFELITRNLQEYLGRDRIKQVLKTRDLKIYWGTATTGKPHIAYFVPMVKIADFLRAGCEVTVLFADLHAYLDNQKAPWDLLRLRTLYYQKIISAILVSIGVDTTKLHFVTGTEYQLSREYSLDVYRILAATTEHDAKKAGAEVVKQVDSPLMSGLVYPLLQALDEEYLKVDAQFGGVDQRKIFTFAEKALPALGYKKRAHLMNGMVGGLSGNKMSSSDPDSKIDLLDSSEAVAIKLKKAFCEEGNITENPILSFLKAVVFPVLSLKDPDFLFKITRPEKHGGTVTFANFDELQAAFADKSVHPSDLKAGTAVALNLLLEPVRKIWENDQELLKLSLEAYPPPKPKIASDISRLELKVGKVVSVEPHPERDNLFVEKIDVGDAEGPRTIVSGLAHFMKASELQGKLVVVATNLKASKFAGVLSQGMVLAASNADKSKVEVLEAPEGATVGECIVFDGYDQTPNPPVLNPKHKVFEKCAVDFRIKDLTAQFRDVSFSTSTGPVFINSIEDGTIG